MVRLYQRLLSALIVEEDPKENNTKLDDGAQGDCLHCTSEEIKKQIESDIEKADDIQSRELDLDQRIILELQSLGIFEELVVFFSLPLSYHCVLNFFGFLCNFLVICFNSFPLFSQI